MLPVAFPTPLLLPPPRPQSPLSRGLPPPWPPPINAYSGKQVRGRGACGKGSTNGVREQGPKEPHTEAQAMEHTRAQHMAGTSEQHAHAFVSARACVVSPYLPGRNDIAWFLSEKPAWHVASGTRHVARGTTSHVVLTRHVCGALPQMARACTRGAWPHRAARVTRHVARCVNPPPVLSRTRPHVRRPAHRFWRQPLGTPLQHDRLPRQGVGRHGPSQHRHGGGWTKQPSLYRGMWYVTLRYCTTIRSQACQLP